MSGTVGKRSYVQQRLCSRRIPRAVDHQHRGVSRLSSAGLIEKIVILMYRLLLFVNVTEPQHLCILVWTLQLCDSYNVLVRAIGI